MTFALNPNLPSDLLSNLIIEDIAPYKEELYPEFKGYVDAMKKIEEMGVRTREEAEGVLIEHEKVLTSKTLLSACSS